MILNTMVETSELVCKSWSCRFNLVLKRLLAQLIVAAGRSIESGDGYFLPPPKSSGRERERERQRQRDRDRDTHRDRQRDRQTETQRDGDRETKKHTERGTERQKHRKRHRETETDKQTDRQAGRQAGRQTVCWESRTENSKPFSESAAMSLRIAVLLRAGFFLSA